AHVVALSRSDAVDEDRRRAIEAAVARHAPQALWIELVHRPTRLVSASGASIEAAELGGKPVAAFCGIGNPAGFRHTLSEAGFAGAGWLELADHCPYGDKEIAQVLDWLQRLEVEHVVCTRKDLVKIPREDLAGKRLLALEIELDITRGREALASILNRITPGLS